MDEEDFPSEAFFRRLGTRMAGDPELAACGRFLDMTLAFASDGVRLVVELRAGQLVDVRPGDDLPVDLVLAGSHDDWANFLAEHPAPGYADIIGMDRRGETFSILGAPETLARHLRALTCVLRLARLEAVSS